MKTFVNLCKKPLLIVSAVLFVVFTVLLIVGYTTPLGKTYSVSNKTTINDFEMTSKSKIVLKTKEKLEVSTTVEFDEAKYKELMLATGDSEASVDRIIEEMKKGETEEYDYVIVDGKLILGLTKEAYDKLSDEEKEAAKKSDETALTVKGYKLSQEIQVKENETKTIDYACTANKPVQIASIVLMAVSGVALIGCVVVLVLSNKGIIKTEAKSEAAAE